MTSCFKNQISQINSTSTMFMGQELGQLIAGDGDFYYDEDKGCFLKIEEGVIVSCFLKTKTVYKILVDCEKYKKITSIDGIVCGEKIEDQTNFKKLCSESTSMDGYFLLKNKSFFWLDNYSQVNMLGIVIGAEFIREEGEAPYSFESCT